MHVGMRLVRVETISDNENEIVESIHRLRSGTGSNFIFTVHSGIPLHLYPLNIVFRFIA